MEDRFDESLTAQVVDELERRFPLDAAPTAFVGRVRTPNLARRNAVRGTFVALAAVATAVVVAQLPAHQGPKEGQVASDPSSSATLNAASIPPDRLKKCFLSWATPRPEDAAYEGLTLKAAAVLARQRNQQLVFVGNTQDCVGVGSNVLYRNAVAVLCDRGTLVDGIPRSAVIVYANSNPAARFDGWNIP